MPIGHDTFAYRRHLPHLVREGKTYFVTFRSRNRQTIPPIARTAALHACILQHKSVCWVQCITIMPDHVHTILQPLDGFTLAECCSV